MPKKNINYQNTVIYIIQNIENPELFYIGHTSDFTKRKCQHKTACIGDETLKGQHKHLHQMIRDNGGWYKFMFLEVKKFPCEDKNMADAECWRLTTDLKMKHLNEQYFKNEDDIKMGVFKRVTQ